MTSYKKNTFVNSFSLALFCILYCSSLRAQNDNESEVSSQLWFDFNPSYKISEKFDFNGRIGSKILPNSAYKFYTSAELSFLLPKFLVKKLKYNDKIYVGSDFYHVFFKETPNVIEIAPFQGYSLSWPNRKRIAILHKAELGERFQWNVESWDFTFGLQLSYEASLTLKLYGDVWEHGKGFYLIVKTKFWWNLISTNLFNDVVRITPGIGYEINPKWKTAFYIGYNYTRNLPSDDFYTDNVIYRFRVYYRIN